MVIDRSFVIASFALAAVFVAPGCDSEPASSQSETVALGDIGKLYLEYVDLLNGVDRHFCDCSVAQGNYADQRECVAANGGPVVSPLVADCYARVLDGISGASDYVKCQFSEYMQYLDCLESAGCGGDIASCQEMIGDADCPDLAYATNAALASECLGYEMPPSFKCADGGEIVPWYECNFWPDCKDGSDEHEGCPEGFQCMSGKMIPKQWACDGSMDCSDGDDEANCD